jgi:hypothetical protein
VQVDPERRYGKPDSDGGLAFVAKVNANGTLDVSYSLTGEYCQRRFFQHEFTLLPLELQLVKGLLTNPPTIIVMVVHFMLLITSILCQYYIV